MLSGDKAFNDKLSWALALPLSLLAASAAALAVLAVELVLEGDVPGRARGFTLPAMGLGVAFSGVGAGAALAPRRKRETALVLSAVYILCLIRAARSELASAEPTLRLWGLALAGAAGAALAVRGAGEGRKI